MTPQTFIQQKLEHAGTFNPAPGTVHISDLINEAKDGLHVNDKLSNYVAGLLLLALHLGIVDFWEVCLFQLPFIYKYRETGLPPHLGSRKKYWRKYRVSPAQNSWIFEFLGPDGRAFELNDGEIADARWAVLTSHPNYPAWLAQHMYAGRGAGARIYNRVHAENTKNSCDKRTNEAYALLHNLQRP